MKKCASCGDEIGDKYQFCLKCNEERLRDRANKNTAEAVLKDDILEKINWNLGMIAKTLRLILIDNLNGKDRTEVQNRIYESITVDLDKDLGIVKELRKKQ